MYTWATEMDKAAEEGGGGTGDRQRARHLQHLGEAYEALTHPSMIGVLGLEIAEMADEWVRMARERPEDRQLLFKALTARGLVQVWVFWTFDEALRARHSKRWSWPERTGSTAAENTARGILGAGLLLVGEWDAAEAELRRSAGQATTLLGVGAIYEWWLMLLLTLRGEAHTAADQMEIWLADDRNTHRAVLMRALLGFNRLRRRRRRGGARGDRGWCRGCLAARCMQCSLTLDSFAAEVKVEPSP